MYGDGIETFGDDYLDGGDGNDILHGGGAAGIDTSNDTLAGGADDDELYGDGGNDTLYSGTGGDFLDGGEGNDVVYADGSFAHRYDFLVGSAGDDVYIVDGGNIVFRIDDYDGGYDRLLISASVALNGVEIEEITLTGNGAYDAEGNSLDNIIRGNAAANLLRGLAGTDELFGNEGSDTLDGGVGYLDTLRGGRGNDTYVVGDYDDIWEDIEQGRDEVQSSVRWVLADNFEDLTLTGGANVNGFGNGLSNRMSGNSGNNYLQGFEAFDVLTGGAGNDYYELSDLSYRKFLGATFDRIVEGEGAGIDTVRVTSLANPDRPFSTNGYRMAANVENGIIAGALAFNLTGNAVDNSLAGNDAINTLNGNAGSDSLDGNGGLDRLAGGGGNDVYFLDDLTFIDDQSGYRYDTVIELQNQGIDKIFVSPQGNGSFYLPDNIENAEVTGAGGLQLIGNNLDNILIGNGGYNLIYGLGGDDKLIGGGGYDDLFGGAGNDSYNLADTTLINSVLEFDGVTEEAGDGIDTVHVSSTAGSPTYALGANVENADVIGETKFDLQGNELKNVLTGNDAANTLSGFEGSDILTGYGGADVLRGGLGRDAANYAYFSNLVGVVADLLTPGTNTGDAAGDSYDSIEDLLGSFYNDDLRGDNGANSLQGGLNGDDALTGRGGDDTLTGGRGADLLNGGAGSDSFDFNLITDSALAAAGRDTVSDFQQGLDEIDLSTIDANAAVAGDQAFSFIGSAAFTAAGQMRAVQLGGNTILFLNNGGDANPDMAITLTGLFTMAGGDFVL